MEPFYCAISPKLGSFIHKLSAANSLSSSGSPSITQNGHFTSTTSSPQHLHVTMLSVLGFGKSADSLPSKMEDRKCCHGHPNSRLFAQASRVHNILSPLRHHRKPLIFQWAFTLRNAGIGSGSNPAFYTLKKEWLPVVTKGRQYIMNQAGYCLRFVTTGSH